MSDLREAQADLIAGRPANTAATYRHASDRFIGWAESVSAQETAADLLAYRAFLRAEGLRESTIDGVYLPIAARLLGIPDPYRVHSKLIALKCPQRCPYCGVEVEKAKKLCPECRTQVNRAQWRKRVATRVPGERKTPIVLSRTASLQERFEAKYQIDSGSGCWIWQGSLNRVTSGYGQFWDGTQQWRAHRWAWVQAHGPILDDLTVDHVCGNTRCVNVAHLRLLTLSKNASLGRQKQLATKA